MIAAWLAWHTLLVARGRRAWPSLVVCTLIVLAKGTYLSPCVLALLLGMLLAAGGRAMCRRLAERKWAFEFALVLGVWLLWCAMAIDTHYATHAARRPAPKAAIHVACLGDSLTAGGYPSLLRRPLIEGHDLGQDGITTRDALAKVVRVKELQPDVVVIELGGHDFLKGRGRAACAADLRTIVAAARDLGAEVVLVEIPRGFIFDPWWGLERQLARELDLELVGDGVIRSFVLFSPYAPPKMWLPAQKHLSDDGLHPNAQGHRYFARAIVAAVRYIYRESLPSGGL